MAALGGRWLRALAAAAVEAGGWAGRSYLPRGVWRGHAAHPAWQPALQPSWSRRGGRPRARQVTKTRPPPSGSAAPAGRGSRRCGGGRGGWGGGGALRWMQWGAATPCRCAPPRNGHGEPAASNSHPPPLPLWPVASGRRAAAPACGGSGGGGGRWRAARPSAAAVGGRRPRRSGRAAATPRWHWRGGGFATADGQAGGLCALVREGARPLLVAHPRRPPGAPAAPAPAAWGRCKAPARPWRWRRGGGRRPVRRQWRLEARLQWSKVGLWQVRLGKLVGGGGWGGGGWRRGSGAGRSHDPQCPRPHTCCPAEGGGAWRVCADFGRAFGWGRSGDAQLVRNDGGASGVGGLPNVGRARWLGCLPDSFVQAPHVGRFSCYKKKKGGFVVTCSVGLPQETLSSAPIAQDYPPLAATRSTRSTNPGRDDHTVRYSPRLTGRLRRGS